MTRAGPGFSGCLSVSAPAIPVSRYFMFPRLCLCLVVQSWRAHVLGWCRLRQVQCVVHAVGAHPRATGKRGYLIPAKGVSKRRKVTRRDPLRSSVQVQVRCDTF